MKHILIILSLSVLNKCSNKVEKQSDMRACVKDKIEEIKKQPVWNPPAEVNEYTYKGKQVYLFSSDCCDQYISLFDSACNYICAPSGGIDGSGDGKCDDFNDSARFVRLVWKDSR